MIPEIVIEELHALREKVELLRFSLWCLLGMLGLTWFYIGLTLIRGGKP